MLHIYVKIIYILMLFLKACKDIVKNIEHPFQFKDEANPRQMCAYACAQAETCCMFG